MMRLASVCEWRLLRSMHSHLICPDCGHETVVHGYASHWRCRVCDNVNAQAIVLCHRDGSTRVPHYDEQTGDKT